jgi:TseV toxin immunity protein TsiV
MDPKAGANFVGIYASFPIAKDGRRVEILKTLLDMEPELHFKRVRLGQTLGKLKDTIFTGEKLPHIIQSLDAGEADYLQLFPYNVGDDWVQISKTSIGMDWSSHVHMPNPNRPLSPIETRFGSAGDIIVQYPLSRFQVDSESDFQRNLLRVMKRLFVEQEMLWAFIHRGFHPIAPRSIGEDDLFRDTREGFPLTSFDADLGRAIFFKEFVKGAFWANFLNPFHVNCLGGMERLMSEKPCKVIEDLGGERVLLQVGPSPLPGDETTAVDDYQRLRRFFKPLLMETGDDMMRIQREILGSWRPPESADKNFRAMLAEMRRKDS